MSNGWRRSFFADYRFLTSPQPARLQAEMGVLTGLVDRVGLQTNVNNTVGIVCYPCCISGGTLEADWYRRMT